MLSRALETYSDDRAVLPSGRGIQGELAYCPPAFGWLTSTQPETSSGTGPIVTVARRVLAWFGLAGSGAVCRPQAPASLSGTLRSAVDSIRLAAPVSRVA